MENTEQATEWFDPACDEPHCNGRHRWVDWPAEVPGETERMIQHTTVVSEEEFLFLQNFVADDG